MARFSDVAEYRAYRAAGGTDPRNRTVADVRAEAKRLGVSYGSLGSDKARGGSAAPRSSSRGGGGRRSYTDTASRDYIRLDWQLSVVITAGMVAAVVDLIRAIGSGGVLDLTAPSPMEPGGPWYRVAGYVGVDEPEKNSRHKRMFSEGYECVQREGVRAAGAMAKVIRDMLGDLGVTGLFKLFGIQSVAMGSALLNIFTGDGFDASWRALMEKAGYLPND